MCRFYIVCFSRSILKSINLTNQYWNIEMLFFKIIKDIVVDKNYRFVFLSLIIVVTVGTVGFHFIENWRWIDSLYYCITTLTTVGYGDFHPQTDLGKIFFIPFIISGLGVLFSFVNAFADKLIKRRANFFEKKT